MVPSVQALRERHNFFSARAESLLEGVDEVTGTWSDPEARTQFHLSNDRALLELNSVLNVISYFQGNAPFARKVMEEAVGIPSLVLSLLTKIVRRLEVEGYADIWMGEMSLLDPQGRQQIYPGITWDVPEVPLHLKKDMPKEFADDEEFRQALLGDQDYPQVIFVENHTFELEK